MTEQLIKDFIKKFPISGEQKEIPYIILFDAFTGMGKSTVSKKNTRIRTFNNTK